MPVDIQNKGTGGPVTQSSPKTDKPSVGSPSPDYEWMRDHWKLPLLLDQETSEIRAQSLAHKQDPAAFVPQLEKEADEDFKNRISNLTVIPPFWDDTLVDVVGTILAEDIRPRREGDEDAVPEELLAWWDGGVDRDGNDGNVFINKVSHDSAGLGLSFIFVDHDEHRPFWVWHQAPSVIEVVFSQKGGEARIERVKIRVRSRQADPSRGAWGWKMVDEIRVYYAGNPSVELGSVVRPHEGDETAASGRNLERYVFWEAYENKAKEGEDAKWPESPDRSGWMLPPNGLPPEAEEVFTEVPLYPWYSKYCGPFRAKPPLLKMAEMIRLWVIKDSDRNAIEQVANVPRDVLTGMTWDELVKANDGNPVLGRGGVICLGHHQAASLTSYEHSGNAIGALRESLKELKEEIGEAAFKTLTQRASGVELATLALLSESKKNTRLHAMRTFWRQGFFSAIRRSAAYFGVAPGAIGEWLWPDMDISRLTSRKESAAFVERLVAVGGMDPQTATEVGIELGLVPDSVDPEKVLERLRELGSAI